MIAYEDQDQRETQEVNEAAAAFGLIPVFQEERTEDLYLWPENVGTWQLFRSLSTQWKYTEGQAVGMDYPGVEVVMRKWRIPRKDELQVFSEIQAMEQATLKAWSERKR